MRRDKTDPSKCKLDVTKGWYIVGKLVLNLYICQFRHEEIFQVDVVHRLENKNSDKYKVDWMQDGMQFGKIFNL